MSKPKMYLAGPITGLSYEGCTDWRKYVASELEGVECLSPLRAKDYLVGHEKIYKSYEGENWFKKTMSGSRGIMKRDHWDCSRCDLIMVNFEGAERVSIGTCMEIAWGYNRMIPIIAVMDELHDHAMLNEAITHRAPGLKEAIEVVRALI